MSLANKNAARLGWRNWHGSEKSLRLLARALFAAGCVLAISLTLTWRFETNEVASQQVGDAAKDDIVAPKALTYVSEVQSQKASERAAINPANNVYRRDEALISKQRDSLNELLTALTNGRGNIVPPKVVIISLQEQPVIKESGLTEDQLNQVLLLSSSTWSEIVGEAKTIHGQLMAMDIRPDTLTNELSRLRNAVYTPWSISPTLSRLDEDARQSVVALVKPFVKANNFIDETATKIKQEEARKKADSVSVNIVKGQSIVRRGEILTTLQLEELQQLGLRSAGSNLENVIGTVGVVAALVLLMVLYFTLLQNQIWGNPRMLFFIGLALIVAAAGMRVLVANYAEHNLRPYILPLAAISMVLAALLDVNLAIFITAVMALLAGYVGQSPEVGAVYFIGGAAGAFLLYKAERTVTFVYAGLAVAAGQFAMGLCFDLAARNLDLGGLGLLAIFNLGNGLISTSLAFFIFSALGKLFGVTTVIQLLELAHPNQPLLRRLMREAPGTYHHSILVSNLAEQATERLMGDALLARVGAYYHDIGKLSQPSNFIDNQGSGPNIHDTIDPRESAKLIKAHVEDGVILARKNHLPRKVVDIIHQHHGTCMISFFYNKALAMGLDVSELDFRYPGPKPQTKVAAIVMLSDGVEAAVRANIQSGRIITGAKPAVPAAQNPDADSGRKQLTIESVVNKIIDDRIRDHQLDECDLTLKDVDELRHLFVEILAGIYHPRIVYPDSAKPNPITAAIEEAKAQPIEGVVIPLREVTVEPVATNSSVVAGVVVGDGAADSGGELPDLDSDSVKEVAGIGAGTTTSKGINRTLSKGGIGGAGRMIGTGSSSKDQENRT